MPRTEDRSIADRVAEVRRVVEHLDVLHICTTIEVCRRREGGPVLRKASDVLSHTWVEPEVDVIEVRRDLDLLLDPRTGERKLRHVQDDPTEFDAIAAKAKRVDITITCHEHQLDAILSTAKIVAVTGGNRAGKTRVLLYWLIRQWLLRGFAPSLGRAGAMFWWIGPTLPKAFKFGCKRGLAALLPAALLVGQPPTSHRASNLALTMIDGSTIEFHHAQDDGGNLKSENVQAIAGDEIGEWKDAGNYQQVNSRISQSGGAAALGTTPVGGHWGHHEIILQEPHSSGAIRVWSIDLFQNPWMTMARIWALFLGDGTLTETELEEVVLPAPDPPAAARAIIKSPRALREHFGVWTADGIRLWAEWTEVIEQMCTRAGNGTTWTKFNASSRLVRGVEVGPQELADVTAQSVAGIFDAESELIDGQLVARPLTRIAGQDFNVNPQTTLVAQVFGDADDPATWVLLVQEEIQTPGTVETHGQRLLGIDRDLGIICDPSGDIPRANQDALDSDDASRLRAMGFRVKSAIARGKKLKSQRPTLTLIHKLTRERRLYVHLRCTQTLKALQTQQAKPDGRIDKRPGTKSPSDQLSAPTDALRYLVWRVFRHELENPTIFET